MIQQEIELRRKGLINDPLYFHFVMGLKNCQPAIENAIPKDSIWNISGSGKNRNFTIFSGISLGGHVRVGLEDNIYYKKIN